MKALLFALLLATSAAFAAEWQFSVPTADGKGRAFLWIPPDCDHVRGVVLSGQVILEKNVLEDPAIRAAAARAGLALVLDMKSTIGNGPDFSEGSEGRKRLQGILDRLAEVSGYAEIAQAPLLTLGHSGGAIFAWNVAYGMPERVFGVIGLKAAPIPAPPGFKPEKGDGAPILNHVPILVVTGQYEAWNNSGRTPEYHWRWVRGGLLRDRAIGRNAQASVLVEPGTGHFSWYPELADYVAMFIEKAAAARLPKERPPAGEFPKLRDIPAEEGWLSDADFFGGSRHATAAFRDYAGDPSLAFWHLDAELARANEAFVAGGKGREFQQLTFFDEGRALEPDWMIEAPFRPLEDGASFRVQAGFLDETSADFSIPAARSIGHAAGAIRYRLIGGWAGGGRQTGPDTFRPAMDRFSWVKPSNSVMVIASHPGDERFSPYEQPVNIKFPARLTEGEAQTITFAPIADQSAEARSVKLDATSSAGLPVEFFVIEGPAGIDGDTLRLTAPPPRARRPITVTVGAWNWGRAVAPRVQTGGPVVRSFLVR